MRPALALSAQAAVARAEAQIAGAFGNCPARPAPARRFPVYTPPEIASILPWASSSNPAWSGPSPAEVASRGGRYGTLIARPGAGRAVVLAHDPAGVLYAMTLFSPPGDVVEMSGRRWRVVPLDGPESGVRAAQAERVAA
jgi:hypothetical protein